MIEMIQRPRIETEELSNDNTYGRFMVEPLASALRWATACAVCFFPACRV